MKRYKVVCPLINFQIQNALIGHKELPEEERTKLLIERENALDEGIDLFGDIKIRRVSKQDFEDFETAPFLLPPHIRLSTSMFVLEKHISDEDAQYPEILAIMLNGVLALRLLKKGNVFGNSIFHILVSEDRRLTGRSWENEPTPEMLGPTYVLDFEEIPALKSIFEKVQRIDFAERRSLHLACKRFQRVYGEGDVEDKLIDLMIAFEALFLKGERTGASAGQIVAVACSILLGKNDDERERIRQFLTKAYSLRNSVVHGSEYHQPFICGETQYFLFDFVPEIENYLRESIKKLLD